LARGSQNISSAVRTRARKIRLLLVDVDGVLTDGHIYLQSLPDGTAAEMKVFSAYDGAGLKLARALGLRTGLITGRNSPAVTRRAQEVGMNFVFQDRGEKLSAYKEILREAGVPDAEVAYVGDYVTVRSGGEGAVREVVELLLKSQGKWGQAIGVARA